MNDPKHARGPWKIDGQFDDDVAVSIVSAEGFDICEIYPLTGEWSEEDIANARLVENCTRLLKALSAAVTEGVMPAAVREEALAAIAAAEATQ